MSHSQETHVLFGPYGTALEQMESQHNMPGLSNPLNILNGPTYRHKLSEVAQGYVQAGATFGTTNTFRLRSLREQVGGEHVARAAIQEHHRALQDAVRTQIATKKIFQGFSFGPARDCYSPAQAPADRRLAKDFHEPFAAEAARTSIDAAWFETINTVEEAVGIALAAKKYGAPCIISFVINKEGNLLSGESPKDAIAAVDSITNGYPLGYGFNCCPIEALEPALKKCGKYARRVIALYPNASSFPQEQLESQALQGNVKGVLDEKGVAEYLNYLAKKYGIKIIGGCCGFNGKNIARISAAVHQDLFSNKVPITDATIHKPNGHVEVTSENHTLIA